ncbi:Rhomboid family protein [compost metagenome]
MILPCPVEPKQILRLPVTLSLVFLNVFIYIVFFSGAGESLASSRILTSDSLIMSGRLYRQYLDQLTPAEVSTRPQWIGAMKAGDPGQMEVLGAFALRDGGFLSQAPSMAFQGDEVAINSWLTDLKDFQSKYFSQVLFQFGLSSVQSGPLSWITYQFSHAGLIHLFSNLVFLIVMGAAVEVTSGSLAVLLIYMAGGFAGGLGFLMANAHGMIPMVGASASVSALLAFYCLAEVRPRIRYAYFVTPIQGQYGFIYLPTLLIIPLFLLVDVSSLLATPEGLGSGVAYSAHLGGSLLGFTAAGMWRLKKYLTINSALLR